MRGSDNLDPRPWRSADCTSCVRGRVRDTAIAAVDGGRRVLGTIIRRSLTLRRVLTMPPSSPNPAASSRCGSFCPRRRSCRSSPCGRLRPWRSRSLALRRSSSPASRDRRSGTRPAWFVLAATVLAALVRAIDIESWALLIPGGFVGRVRQAFGPRAARVAAAVALVERLLLGALACVVVGHYVAGVVGHRHRRTGVSPGYVRPEDLATLARGRRDRAAVDPGAHRARPSVATRWREASGSASGSSLLTVHLGRSSRSHGVAPRRFRCSRSPPPPWPSRAGR